MLTVTNNCLDSLLARIRRCRSCDLPHGCSPVLSAAGGQRLMLIGQAPGRQEPEKGRPFAGAAGRRLMAWFAGIGWSEALVRQRLHMTAVMKCYPGPSPSGKGDRRPSAAELAACSGHLQAELALTRPAVIVLVGQLAIARFLPGRPLSEVVGREFHHADDWGVAWLIPLPHPSGASLWLNRPEHQARLGQALALLAARIGPGDLP